MRTYKHGLTTVKLVTKDELAALKARKKKYNDPTAFELYRKEHPEKGFLPSLGGFAGQVVYIFVAYMLFMYVATKVTGYFNFHDPVVFLVSTGVFVYGLVKLFSHFNDKF